MTLAEYQAAIAAIEVKATASQRVTNDMYAFVDRARIRINDPKFSPTLDVDADLAVQLPLYEAFRTQVRAAALDLI